jgi:hypothetical protein
MKRLHFKPGTTFTFDLYFGVLVRTSRKRRKRKIKVLFALGAAMISQQRLFFRMCSDLARLSDWELYEAG